MQSLPSFDEELVREMNVWIRKIKWKIIIYTFKPASLAPITTIAYSGMFGAIIAIVSPGRRLLFLNDVASLPHNLLN